MTVMKADEQGWLIFLMYLLNADATHQPPNRGKYFPVADWEE
jgi:hypothetical protein